MIVGGVGTGEFAAAGAPNIKGSILMVDNVLYVTAPDNVWALDVHDGHVLWQCLLEDARRHAHRQPRRGAAVQHAVLRNPRQLPRRARREDRSGEMARRDRRLRAAVLLDHRSGRRRQPRHRRHRQQSGCARLLQVLRRRPGKLQWKLYRADESGRSGLETWPSLDAARHGGGHRGSQAQPSETRPTSSGR